MAQVNQYHRRTPLAVSRSGLVPLFRVGTPVLARDGGRGVRSDRDGGRSSVQPLSTPPRLSRRTQRVLDLAHELARLEAKVAIEEILRRLPNVRRADDAPLPRIQSFIFYGVKSLPMAFDAAVAAGR